MPSRTLTSKHSEVVQLVCIWTCLRLFYNLTHCIENYSKMVHVWSKLTAVAWRRDDYSLSINVKNNLQLLASSRVFNRPGLIWFYLYWHLPKWVFRFCFVHGRHNNVPYQLVHQCCCSPDKEGPPSCGYNVFAVLVLHSTSEEHVISSNVFLPSETDITGVLSVFLCFNLYVRVSRLLKITVWQNHPNKLSSDYSTTSRGRNLQTFPSCQYPTRSPKDQSRDSLQPHMWLRWQQSMRFAWKWSSC